MSRRYLVVSGGETALRLIAPARGALKVGSSLGADIRVVEPGVESTHAELFIGQALGVRAHAQDVAIVDAGNERERAIDPGGVVDLEDGQRIRVGPIEIVLAEGLPATAEPRLWDQAELEARMAQATDGTVIRAIGDETLARKASARLRPEDVIAILAPDELAFFLPGARPSDAHVILGGLGATAAGAAALGPEGAQAALEAARPSSTWSTVEISRVPSADPAMAGVERLLEQAAESDDAVMILGETGTGKDLIVSELHRRSTRARMPLVRVSAVEMGEGGIPLEATRRCAGGTLFLDEVSSLSARAQLALTQDLERSDLATARVIATSNQDLEGAVEAGDFRKDLFFRLARFRVDLPPLRQRKGDIRVLTTAFLEAAGITDSPSLAVLDVLDRHPWPGNVRELEGVLSRAVSASGGGSIQLEHLPPELVSAKEEPARTRAAESADASDDGPISLRDEMANLERRRILEALEREPTQTEAAKALGIPLRTFLNRMDALGIPRARKK